MFEGFSLLGYSHFWLGPTDRRGGRMDGSRGNETSNQEERVFLIVLVLLGALSTRQLPQQNWRARGTAGLRSGGGSEDHQGGSGWPSLPTAAVETSAALCCQENLAVRLASDFRSS